MELIARWLRRLPLPLRCRTEPTRLPELMSHDRAALDALLESTIIGQVAFVAEDGSPAVLPTAVARWGDRLIVHGSTGSRWMRLVAGSRAVVSITTVDGIIVARSAFESFLAYRSAVLFGSFPELEGDEKSAALDALTDRLIPARLAEVRPSTQKELAAAVVLAMPITEWSLRVSDGWSEDDIGRLRSGTRPGWALAARYAPMMLGQPVSGFRIQTPVRRSLAAVLRSST